MLEGVKECHRIVSPYKLASRTFRPQGTIVRIGNVEIGGGRVAIMAGFMVLLIIVAALIVSHTVG